MKKSIALILAVILILGLAACGSSGQQGGSSETTPAGSSAEETSKAESTPQESTPSESEAQTPGEIIEVGYHCSIGAYSMILDEEIKKWNDTTGKELGVRILFDTDINAYTNNTDALLQAGTRYDIMDGARTVAWIEQGYLLDLNTIKDDYPELAELMDSYGEDLIKAFNINNENVYGLPLEVRPIKFAVNKDLFEQCNLDYPTTWEEVVECAKVITENTDDGIYGFGWSTWSACFRRLVMKASMGSTGRGWWDPNTGTYDFTPFKMGVEAIATMYQNGWILGADDLAIDPIRAEFSAGRVGMFPAVSYDISVYTNQFPAECNWEIIDSPKYTDADPEYCSVYITQCNCAIGADHWAEADDAKKQAIINAFLFLNSDYLNGVIYANCGMIPAKQSIIENTELVVDAPQWEKMADLTNFAPMCRYPDGLLAIEGETFEQVFREVMYGNIPFDEAAADLNERYNAAYEELVADGEDVSPYNYTYDLSIK